MEKQKLYAGRDPYGVRPLFRLTNPTEGVLGFSSEGKGNYYVFISSDFGRKL
jgi:asparagine synthetase B (glutamine-hydrolysing)